MLSEATHQRSIQSAAPEVAPRIVSIIDYGVGNIGSLQNMLEFVGVGNKVASSEPSIADAECLILPGVGAFDTAMVELKRRGLINALNEVVLVRRVPVLGICLGMQILGRSSEEGREAGLGWIDARAVRLQAPPGSELRVPHVGWAEVSIPFASAIFPDPAAVERYYFVHSYALQCADKNVVAGKIDFDGDVCCAVARDNIFGVQFHPEKSHRFGMRLLKNFAHHA
jgi:imidazole glycerol-phosphate synthase subunit HisH